MIKRVSPLAVAALAILSVAGCATGGAVTPAPTAPAPSTSASSVASGTATASPAASTSADQPVSAGPTAGSASGPVAESATPAQGAPAPSSATPGHTSATNTAGNPAASAPAWIMHGNARFGFSAPVPAAWGVDASAGNGDGFTASGPNGATVEYNGSNVLTDPATTSVCQPSREAWTGRGLAVTYATESATSCIFSGTLGADVIYVRQWIGQGSRVIMTWQYPQASAGSVDELVSYAGQHLRPGDLSVAH